MSGVVLRCSTCGTTQSHLGECEACQEGTVRYFCGNHNPGVWLSEPTCNLCGAKFGEKPNKRPEPTPFVTPPRPSREKTRRPDPHPTGESRRPEPRTPTPRRVVTPDPDFGRKREEPDPDETSVPPSLADLLAGMVKERRHEFEEAPRWETTAEPPRPRGVPVLGCLLRLVILVIMFIIFVLGGLFLLMSGGF